MPGIPTHPNRSAYPEAQVLPGLLASQRLVKNVWTAVVDLIFPPRCAGCDRLDHWWCERCQGEIEQMPFPEHVRAVPPLAEVACTAIHTGKAQRAVWALKYENCRALAEPLGARLVNRLSALNWTIDMVAPVPLHTSRLAERGYNQAQLLSEYVASGMTLPSYPMALIRHRRTESQVTMNAEERRANMEDAFHADPYLVNNQILLLIDDVYTTGATLSACAAAALTAGARAVYGLTVTMAAGQ
jgi:ComF family protein